VRDDRGRPVANVKIILTGKILALSGKDGFFSLASPRAKSSFALTFVAEGYVSRTKVFEPDATDGNVVVIWPVAYRIKFDPARELDIELGTSHVVIPANALSGPGKESFSGPAVLRYTWFDVSDPLQRAAVPGNFAGRMLDRSVRRLNSFGIFDIAVTDARSRDLTLREGADVELAVPVPRALAAQAPTQVGFFDFELASGQWLQVGTAAIDPRALAYQVVIHRFAGPDGSTAHNLDDPQDTTCVRVQVVSFFDNSGLPGLTAIAHGAQYDYQTITDANGYACFLVQRNGTFWVEAYGVYQSTYWGASGGPTFTAPNTSHPDCSDPCCCPIVGTVPLSPPVGTARRIPSSGL
jgi:hypothetical protein